MRVVTVKMLRPRVSKPHHSLLAAIPNVLTQLSAGAESHLRVVIIAVGGVDGTEEVNESIGTLAAEQRLVDEEVSLSLYLRFLVLEVWEADVGPAHGLHGRADRDLRHAGACVLPISL